MFPIRDDQELRRPSTVVWTLVALNVALYLWDRGGSVFGPRTVFSDLGLRPAELIDSLRGSEKSPLVTLYTSMFLHGNLWHLVGNLLYLGVFGPAIEQAIGPWRFGLYYLAWGVAAVLAETFVSPHSSVPIIGASGAISGILGMYLVLFPTNRITIWFFFNEFDVPAYALLGVFFLKDVLLQTPGVANWAHIGGFLAGMLFVQLMGGRDRVLARYVRENRSLA
ncbi:MAG: rhomboid family intramembrane serine protease [Fimbriimonadales bacterium]|nr:rhomboid family intramembrane serine protease [Fimbriimonadales bacterium]